MVLDKEQREAVETFVNKVIVIASSGSGKTRLLVERLKYLVSTGVAYEDIAAITFTNLAAEEMRSRLGPEFARVYIGTIHSLASLCLRRSGVEVDDILEEEEFDDLFERVKENPESCRGRYKYILWDEVQDSDELQFDFVKNYLQPEGFFFVLDPRQTIYQFNGANPNLAMDLLQDPTVKGYFLYNNYRSGENVLNFAKKIIRPTGLIDESKSKVSFSGEVHELRYSIDHIYEILKDDPYDDWAILTRSNKEASDVITFLKQRRIKTDTFKIKDMTRKELQNRLRAESVKVLTVHSAKGMEFENVIVVGMRFYNAEERNVGYVAATRAKRRLYWLSPPPFQKRKKSNYFEFDPV